MDYMIIGFLAINFLFLVTQYIAIRRLKKQFKILLSFLGREEEDTTVKKTLV